jgi:hypothetical protein
MSDRGVTVIPDCAAATSALNASCSTRIRLAHTTSRSPSRGAFVVVAAVDQRDVELSSTLAKDAECGLRHLAGFRGPREMTFSANATKYSS